MLTIKPRQYWIFCAQQRKCSDPDLPLYRKPQFTEEANLFSPQFTINTRPFATSLPFRHPKM
jgi:hypothetical protein